MKEKLRKNSKLIYAILVIALIAIIYYFTISSKPEAPKPQPVPVQTIRVQKQDVPYYLSGVGNVHSPHTAEIRTRVDGELTKIYFKEGQEVKEGDLLAEIDSRTLTAELAKAKAESARANAELQTAKLDQDRYNNLLKDDAIAKQTADQQQAKVKQLAATLQSANAAIEADEVLLSYTKITSPVTGRVGIRRVDAGNIVKTSDAQGIVKVTQVQPINAIFTLSQSELPQLQKTMQEKEIPIDAMLKDSEDKANPIIATGKLEAIDNEIDDTTGTIRVRAVFENKNNELWPGQLIVLRVLAGTHKDATVVPVSTIQRGRDNNFVFVIKDGKAVVTNVTIEYENSEIAVIKDGLTLQDEVVIDGQSRLKPDSPVKITNSNKADGK